MYPRGTEQPRDLMRARSEADQERLAELDDEYYDLGASTHLDQVMRVLSTGT